MRSYHRKSIEESQSVIISIHIIKLSYQIVPGLTSHPLFNFSSMKQYVSWKRWGASQTIYKEPAASSFIKSLKKHRLGCEATATDSLWLTASNNSKLAQLVRQRRLKSLGSARSGTAAIRLIRTINQQSLIIISRGMQEVCYAQLLQASSQQMDSLQTQLALLNRTYLQEIKQLKEVLRQKTVKQTALKTQIQHLKTQCKNHGEQVASLLTNTLSPVKSHKSRKSDAETSICLQPSTKRSQQDLNLDLSLKFLLPGQQNNKKMNSPRYKILKQTTAMENIEQKLKNSHKQMLLGQKKVSTTGSFIPLKQTSLCQKNTQKNSRYSYEFDKSNASPKQKKDLVRSIGFRTKINPEDKSLESKKSL